VICFAKASDKLIHQPGARANEFVFGLLTDFRKFQPSIFTRNIHKASPVATSIAADELRPEPSAPRHEQEIGRRKCHGQLLELNRDAERIIAQCFRPCAAGFARSISDLLPKMSEWNLNDRIVRVATATQVETLIAPASRIFVVVGVLADQLTRPGAR